MGRGRERDANPLSACARRMVTGQLEARGVTDPRLLDAFGRVPRHCFVPDAEPAEAYGDHPLPIGWGQTISQPYVVAVSLEALELTPACRVLEIGAGCGYQTALLAELVERVWSVECVPELADRARAVLERLGYDNVDLRTGDGRQGWPTAGVAPFDAIVGSAAPARIPPPLLDQLEDGGRLVMPVGQAHQELVQVQRRGDRYDRRNLLPVRFVPMR